MSSKKNLSILAERFCTSMYMILLFHPPEAIRHTTHIHFKSFHNQILSKNFTAQSNASNFT
jgi:hypothetical protein